MSSQDFLAALTLPPSDSPSRSEEELHSPAESIVASEESYPVDTYADRLMDDIFGEVEHILDSGVVPPELDEQIEVVSIRSLTMPAVSLPSSLVPRLDAYSPQSDSMQSYTVPHAAVAEPTLSPLFDRLLLGAVLVSCGITLAWWAIDRDRYNALLNTVPSEVTAPAPRSDLAAADAEFIQYLQRSLESLDAPKTEVASPATIASTTPSIPGIEPPGSLPTIAIPGTPSIGDLSSLPPTGVPGNPAAPQTVLERVYIPVYPNTPGSTPPQSIAAGSLPGILNPAPPLLAAGNLPNVPVAAPVPPAVAPKPPSGTTQDSRVSPIPDVPVISHSLVGILELGDQSAALFQVNGVTRRVHLGESVGSAGWMLVDVSNEEAVIRRNGEVRSVYIGQTF